MRYVISDIHGNYDLFIKLLKKIKFSRNDKLYILGDIIDKGKHVDMLLHAIFETLKNNVFVLCGNHEYEFMKFVKTLIIKDASDSKIESECKKFLGINNITFSEIENIMNLPFYYEENDFILVHAGIPFNSNGIPLPLKQATREELVYDRRFKNENFLPTNCKCVIFGHTPTFYIEGKKGKIVKYQKPNTSGKSPKDFYKIHIDTGNYITGILGCIRLDDMQEFYVNEFED